LVADLPDSRTNLCDNLRLPPRPCADRFRCSDGRDPNPIFPGEVLYNALGHVRRFPHPALKPTAKLHSILDPISISRSHTTVHYMPLVRIVVNIIVRLDVNPDGRILFRMSRVSADGPCQPGVKEPGLP